MRLLAVLSLVLLAGCADKFVVERVTANHYIISADLTRATEGNVMHKARALCPEGYKETGRSVLPTQLSRITLRLAVSCL
jgi:hypothetical protein